MSNLKLVPDAPTPLEKMLLDASRAERPSDEHKARLRAALGLGAPLAAPLPAPPAPVAEVARVTRKSLSATKVASGLAALALIGALVVARRSEPPTVAPARVVAPVEVGTSQVASPVAEPPAPAVSALPPVVEAAPRVGRSAPQPAASADLSEQIRLIEAARSGLAARDTKSALSALGSYASRFPRGAFGQEALVLRIRAVDQSGDFARATALAKSFVARFPQSPHVARLKPIAERGTSR